MSIINKSDIDQSMDPPIDVLEEINQNKLSFQQWLIFFICCLSIAADGFDTGVIGFIGSGIADSWGIARSDLVGPVVSAALIGMVVGALSAGPIADRIGRKTMVLASVIFLGFWTLASAYATSVLELQFYRFLTGIGLGAAMPNIATLLIEFMPRRIRATMVLLMLAVFTGGIAIGGWVSGFVMPDYGWERVLIIGGVFPLLLSIFILFFLPESLQFMIVRKRNQVKIGRILSKITGTIYQQSAKFVVDEKLVTDSGKSAVRLIFIPDYRRNTYLLWLTSFMNLLIFYLIASWITIYLLESGSTQVEALRLAPLFPLGGALGSIFVGMAMDRYHAIKTVMVCFILATFTMIVLGLNYQNSFIFGMFFLILGALISGCQSGLSVISATLYPVQSRATGMSWMHGAGRLGGIVGAMGGGYLLKVGFNLTSIFIILAIPTIITAISVFYLKEPHISEENESADSGEDLEDTELHND